MDLSFMVELDVSFYSDYGTCEQPF